MKLSAPMRRALIGEQINTGQASSTSALRLKTNINCLFQKKRNEKQAIINLHEILIQNFNVQIFYTHFVFDLQILLENGSFNFLTQFQK